METDSWDPRGMGSSLRRGQSQAASQTRGPGPRIPVDNDAPLDTCGPRRVPTREADARQPTLDGNTLRVYYPTPASWRSYRWMRHRLQE